MEEFSTLSINNNSCISKPPYQPFGFFGHSIHGGIIHENSSNFIEQSIKMVDSSSKGLNKDICEHVIFENNNELIKIINNFFSNNILEEIIVFFNKKSWKCLCKIDKNLTNKQIDCPFWKIELENEPLFNSYLSSSIEKYFNKKLHLLRIYAVSQTYQQNSNYHYDEPEKGYYTFCYYINNNYEKIEDDGLFYIKIPNQTHILNIEPIMNRLVMFPSYYRHKGSSYNNSNDNLRICIAWKYKILE